MIMLLPALIIGVLVPLVLVAFYWPWLVNQCSFYLFDITYGWEPFCTYIGNAIAHGRYPLWNPYVLSGISQAAVMGPSPAYLPDLLFALLPFNSALACLFVINQSIAGIGMYLLIKEGKWGTWAALLGGVGFALCSLLFSLQGTNSLQATAAWLPICMWSFFKIEDRQLDTSLRFTALSAVLVYFILAPGVPEIAALELVMILLWSGLLFVRSSEHSKRRVLAFRILALALGSALTMPEILPVLEWTRISSRAWGLDFKELFEWSVNWNDLINMVLMQPLGDTQLLDNKYLPLVTSSSAFVPYIQSSYLGPVVLTLAAWGFGDRSWRSRFWVLGLLVIALLVALGKNTAFLPWLVGTLQFKLFRYPVKALVFVVLAALVAAARGMLCLGERRIPQSNLIATIMWCVILLIGISLLLPQANMAAASLFTDTLPAQLTALIPDAIHKIAVSAVPAALLGLLVCGAGWAVQNSKLRGTLACALCVLTVAATFLLQACTTFRHAAPANFFSEHQPLRDKVSQAAQQVNPHGLIRLAPLYLRAFPPAQVRPQDNPTLFAYQYGRQCFAGAQFIDAQISVPLSVQVGQTMESFRLGAVAYNGYYKDDSSELSNFCRLTGTDFVLQQIHDTYFDGSSERARKSLDPNLFDLIYVDAPQTIRLYRAKDSLPRTYFAKQIKWGHPHEEVLRHIGLSKTSGFDPRQLTILEHNAQNEQAPSAKEIPADATLSTVTVAKDNPESIELQVDNPADNYLILTDTFYPGWHATVDGQKSPIYRANGMFRAVFVPKGKHTIAFQFAPASLFIGFMLAAVAAIIALGLLLASVYFSTAKSAKNVEQ